MPSAAGKRVGRVLAGRSKPEAGDKPGLSYLASDLSNEITAYVSKTTPSDRAMQSTRSEAPSPLHHFRSGYTRDLEFTE